MPDRKITKVIFEKEIVPKIDRAKKLARRKRKLIGYPLNTFKMLEKKMDGIQSGFYLWAGISQSSKTMNMSNMCYEISEENKDVYIIYFSIDDDFNTIYYRMLARETRIPINDVMLIERYIENEKNNKKRTRKEILEWYELCEKKIKERMKKVFVFDANTTIYIEDMIKIVDKIYNEVSVRNNENEVINSNIVVLIDNFHLMEFKDVEKQSFGDKTKVTQMSHAVKKNMVVKYDIPVMATAELRKLNHVGTPDLDSLKESVSLRYDANAVFLVHNDTVSKIGETLLYWFWKGDGTIGIASDWIQDYSHLSVEEQFELIQEAKDKNIFKPIILLIIAKNKLSGFEGKLFYALDNTRATLYELPKELQAKLRLIPIEFMNYYEKELRKQKK